jgi:hypothetical protein
MGLTAAGLNARKRSMPSSQSRRVRRGKPRCLPYACIIGGGGQCYLAGTLILTPDGPRDVSLLKIGDSVVTYSGKAKPIKWIGRNRFSQEPRKLVQPRSRSPVSPWMDRRRVQNLYLSAGHAIYLDGMLIQVGSLINGETIALDPSADREVLAEGAATETLLPSADRKLFDNWQAYEALYGAEPVTEAKAFTSEIYLSGGCAQLRSRLRSAFAPWIDRRQPFDVVRDRLEQRAEFVKTAA